jgi:thiol-disulfide isomerase/thioredoxin
MSSEDIVHVCPSCKKQDITSFHSCRYCGTRYDARIDDKQGSRIDQKFLIYTCIAVLSIGILIWAKNAMKEARNKQLSPIITQVRAAHKPRVLEFYADWCGPCRSYGPVIEACRAKYAGQIDFQRFNVDDASSRPTAQACGVSAIPKTCMFDSEGNEIAEAVGGLSPEALDDYMQKLLRSK